MMPVTTQPWAICPVECCEYAEEYDSNASQFCPDCGIELVWECPACQCAVTDEEQTLCTQCGHCLKS